MDKPILNTRVLIFCLLTPLLTGAISSILTRDAMKQYFLMNKPALSPPGWLFPIVWTLLYIMMGIAFYLVITSQADKTLVRNAVLFFLAQLVMNFFWSILFFTFSRYLFSFIWLMGMWAVIIITTVFFFRINRASGFMMLPLILWTSFAAYLNFAVYKLSITPMLLHK